MSAPSLQEVPIDKIVIPEERARSQLNEEQRELLRASLSHYGFVQPIVVKPIGGGYYELIDGENRLNEAKQLGQKTVKAVVLDLSDREANLLNLLMNIARGTQDPIGEAVAIKKALDAGASLEEVARICGRSVQWVKDRLLLLELPDDYKEAVRQGKLTLAHIKEALKLPTPEEIDAALQTAIRLGWSASVLKHYVEHRLESLKQYQAEHPGAPPPPPPSVEEAAEVVRYGQCLICGRMVPRNTLYLPAVCAECYEFARYAVSQCGTGNKGMNTLYQALMSHTSLMQATQFLAYQAAAQQAGLVPQQPQPSQQIQNIQPQQPQQLVTPTPPGAPRPPTSQQGPGQESAP